MNLSKKRKQLLLKLLNRSDILSMLSSTYMEQDKKGFKEDYEATFKEADEAIDALIHFLQK